MDINIKLYEYSEKLEKYYNDKHIFLDSYLLKFLNNKNKQEQYEEVKKKIKLLITKIKKAIKNIKNKNDKTDIIKFVSIIYNIFNEIYECNIIDDKKSFHTILVLLKLLNKLKEYLNQENSSECSSSSGNQCEQNCNSTIEKSEKSTESEKVINEPVYENYLEELTIDIKKLLQNIICNFSTLLNVNINLIKLISAYIIYLENKPTEEIIKIFVDDYNYNLKLLIKNIFKSSTYKNEKIKNYIDCNLINEILNIDNNFDFLKYDIKPEKQLCILKDYIKRLRCIENLLENNIERILVKNIY